MTTLLIKTDNTPLTINLPMIAPMTREAFNGADRSPDAAWIRGDRWNAR